MKDEESPDISRFTNSSEKRAENRKLSPKILEERGIHFFSNNDGAHLIVTFIDYHGEAMVIDFWPGTGLWKPRFPLYGEGRGVFPLCRYVNHRRKKCETIEDKMRAAETALLQNRPIRSGSSTSESSEPEL